MCRVSVVMGVYQPKKEWLEKSIRSILAQTFQDFELIIVCDGNGETLPFLRVWEEQDERIKVFYYEENKGLAFALNYGISRAKGEFIARQDDDDFSLPNRLERQVFYLSKHENISFVCSNAEIFDDDGDYATAQMPENPNKQDFLFTCPFLHPTMLIRRKTLEKIGGYQVAWYTKKSEDYDLYMRLFARGFAGVNLQENLYRYRFFRTGNRKRTFLDRLGECWVRIKGFCRLKVGIKGVVYAVKPLVVWLLPQRFFEKRRKYIK